jgi:hypothetical protein
MDGATKPPLPLTLDCNRFNNQYGRLHIAAGGRGQCVLWTTSSTKGILDNEVLLALASLLCGEVCGIVLLLALVFAESKPANRCWYTK